MRATAPIRAKWRLALILMLPTLLCACPDPPCCAVITEFTVSPKWICAGDVNVTPELDFRFQKFNHKRKHCSDGTHLYGLSETTQGPFGSATAQPIVSSTTPPDPLIEEVKGKVFKTPDPGIFAISGVASDRQFTLNVGNTTCSTEAEQYLINHQQELEALIGLPLADGFSMRAAVELRVIGTLESKDTLCVPYAPTSALAAAPPAPGFSWEADYHLAGSNVLSTSIQLVALGNPSSYEITVQHQEVGSQSSTGWVLQPAGETGARVDLGSSPRNPNGTWRVRINDATDLADYLDHGMEYVDKPSICIDVWVRCIPP